MGALQGSARSRKVRASFAATNSAVAFGPAQYRAFGRKRCEKWSSVPREKS
jgi:hypothetical protein